MCIEGSWNNHNLVEATGRADHDLSRAVNQGLVPLANVHRVNSYYRNYRRAKIDLVIIPTDFDKNLYMQIQDTKCQNYDTKTNI